MARVYIWKPSLHHKSVGHVSMKIPGAYISWWPDKGNPIEQAELSVKGKIHNSLSDDVKEEHRSYDAEIEVPGLNEHKILLYWRSWSSHGRYSGLHMSCATTVAHALLVGGAGNSLKHNKPRKLWTPVECGELARSVSGAKDVSHHSTNHHGS